MSITYPPCQFVVICGRTGSGKTTLAHELPIEKRVVSFTERDPRPDEKGERYEHISPSKFQRMLDARHFAWTECIRGRRYGTTHYHLAQSVIEGTPALLVLSMKGMFSLRSGYGESVLSFYLSSPGDEILSQRMRERGESEQSIAARLENTRWWDRDVFDYKAECPDSRIILVPVLDPGETLDFVKRRLACHLPNL